MKHEYLDAKPNEAEWARRSNQESISATKAFDRLVRFAEFSETGQGRTVSRFIAALIGARPYDMYDLRLLDVDISDDMLVCMGALRWRGGSLVDLVPNGRERCVPLCRERGLLPEE